MIKVDDRTEEQRKTHRLGVVAKDSFMSGWGRARNGSSRCAWACASPADAERLCAWVRGREEMRDVQVTDLRTYRPPQGTAHWHIYVATDNHPALAKVGLSECDCSRWTLDNDDRCVNCGRKCQPHAMTATKQPAQLAPPRNPLKP
jgi:hypothetical protein